MTKNQEIALQRLNDANGRGVVMHVAIGAALVKAGKAVKLDTTGHGKLQAEYRAV